MVYRYKLYSDIDLIKGVMQSKAEITAGKGKTFKSDKEMDKYFKEL